MTNPESEKSHFKRSKTSLQRQKKSERIGSDAPEQIKPDDQDNKQEEMYKTLIENIPCAVYSAFPGERGPTTFMSQNWKDWTGYSAEEFYQDPEAWPKCIYPDDREKAVNAYVEACNNEASYNLEYRIVHRETGQVRYVRDQGLLSKDAKGTLIRVDGNITDITEVKTSENELVKYRDRLEELVKERTAELEKANEVLRMQDTERKQAEEALRESEEKYRQLFETEMDAIMIFDAETREFLDVNDAAIRLYGYCREEFLNLIQTDIAVEQEASDVSIKKTTERHPISIPLRYHKKKDGTIFPVEISGSSFFLNGRKVICGVVRDITERKEAEESLCESENRYKAVIDNAQEGIVVVQDRMLKFVNPAVMAIMGYTEEELMSKSFIEFVHPDDREQVMDIHLKRYKGEEVPPVYECRIVDKQDNAKWAENNGILIEWEGRPATLNFLRDVTERKKTEEELKKHQYYLEKAQDIGCIGTWELDIEENILVWTDENYRIFGIPKGTELTYEVFLNCVHPDDKEYVDKKWKASFNKEPYDIEHRILVDGEVKWVREKAELDFDDKGSCVRGIGFTQDITERKKAEMELKENEERFRSLSNAAFEGIVITKEGRFVDANIAFTNLFGYEPDEITGKEVMMLVASEDRKLVLKNIQSGYEKPYEHKALRKDGSILDVEVCGKTVLIKGQECRITAIRDITERKKAEEKLLDYQAKLKSLASQLSLTEESERRRIATELHDQIGQSLVFSKLKLDELHQTATSSELTKALDEICNNIDQVIQDTRTLTFDLSSPVLNEIGLEAAVAEWLDVQVGEKHGIETEFVDDRQQKPLDDDIRALLFRNVRELLVNVIKHADAHKVKVSFRRVNEHIQIDVEDNGKGFDSVKVISTAIEDTKFGLFSIRQRLEQLGGQFEIDTEESRGSKITMTAPLKLMKSQS